jgi:hypothetical protein
MSTMPKPIEWAPLKSMSSIPDWVAPQYGMTEINGKWAILLRYQWSQYEPSLVMVVDSRDAAIGFVKLLMEKRNEY